MSLLSTNNLITDDILFEYGFRKNEHIRYNMGYKVTYVPGHFYKEVKIKIKLFDHDNLDFIIHCMGILDYDPSNQSITLFRESYEENSFSTNILFRENVEDEIDLKAIISYVENNIYY